MKDVAADLLQGFHAHQIKGKPFQNFQIRSGCPSKFFRIGQEENLGKSSVGSNFPGNDKAVSAIVSSSTENQYLFPEMPISRFKTAADANPAFSINISSGIARFSMAYLSMARISRTLHTLMTHSFALRFRQPFHFLFIFNRDGYQEGIFKIVFSGEVVLNSSAVSRGE